MYSKTTPVLDDVAGERTFAYSIIEERQSGIIYVNNNSINNALFWHYCGYGLLVGKTFCKETIAFTLDMLNRKHPLSGAGLVLQVCNDSLNQLLNKDIRNDTEIRTGKRLIFKLNQSQFFRSITPCPPNYGIVRIDDNNYYNIKGNIVPSFSWASFDEFKKNGVGFCLMDKESILSIVFSSFVGNGQVDIGIETPPKYRKQGFAKQLASTMISYCLNNNLEPTWGCVKENISSIKIATSLGFELVDETPYYYKLQR